MTYYETVFIARQDLTETQVKDLASKYTDVISKNGGKVVKTEHWGLRTLAYKINKSRKGHYVLLESDSTGETVSELDRLLRLDEDIMRSMTIRLEGATTEPSVILGNTGAKTDTRTKKEAA